MKKYILILTIIGLISFTYAGQDLQFVDETPEIHPVDATLALEADFTTGGEETEVILEREIENGFNEELSRTTCPRNSYCMIEYDFDPQEEIEGEEEDINFIVFSTSGTGEDQHEVSFREIEIQDLYFEEAPPEDASVNTEYDIVGTAEGSELKDVELFANGEHIETQQCDNTEREECTLEYSNYMETTETEVDFELVGIAGDDYAMREAQHNSRFFETTIDNIELELSDEEVTKGDEISASVYAEGTGLDEIQLSKRKRGGSWERYTQDCGGFENQDCDISEEFELDEATTYEFEGKIFAGDKTERTERKEVEVSKEDDEPTYNIEDVSITPSEDKVLSVGQTQEIEGNAEGTSLTDLEIQKSEDQEDWENIQTKDCSQSSDCSITSEQTFDEQTTKYYRINASAGPERELSDEVKIEWRDAERCDIDVSELELDPRMIYQDETSTASFEVTNDGDQQDIDIEYRVRGETVNRDSATVDSDETKEFSQEVTTDRDYSTVRVIVETDGEPCGYKDFQRTNTLFLLSGEREAELEVNVRDTRGNNLESAEVEINDRTKLTNADGKAVFKLPADHYSVEASKDNYYTETKSVSLNSGEEKSIQFELEERTEDEEKGRITAKVENTSGDSIENARVTAQNSDRVVTRTDENGEAEFELTPDRYDVEASKAGYSTETKSIRVRENDDLTQNFVLEQRETPRATINKLEHDSNVCEGRNLEVTSEIESSSSRSQVVDIKATAFGEEVRRSLELDAGETKNVRTVFTNARPIGEETIEFEIEQYGSTKTSTVEVEECPRDEETTTTRQPTGLTASVSQREIVAGESVAIRGYVDGVRGSTEVEIQVDGRTATRTDTRRDGYYTAYIRPSGVGTKNIDIKAGDITKSRSVEVLPTAHIDHLEAPNRVFQGEEFEICADVQAQRSSRILLVKDGETIQSQDGRGETCFTVEADMRGEQEYEIRALASGRDGSASRTIEVLEQGNQVESFPDQVASVRSGSSIVKVDLYNTEDSLKTYDLELEGLPDTWSTQTQKTVNLPQGERKTAYFYLTPRDEGEFRPTLSISSDGETIYSEDVIMEIGGSDVREERTIWQRLRDRFSGWTRV